MPTDFRQITSNFGVWFKRMPPEKRTGLLVSLGLTLAAITALSIWAFRPQYKTLYSDLSLEDSGQIIEILQKDNIPYKLEQEGKRILVPADKVYQTRLKLAAAELPREHGAGWEIFDRTNLGVTDFVQKLNYRRALEGELARTILQLDQIDAVRVHLVIPEESLFRENKKSPAASVTLRMKRGNRLQPSQVDGIAYLVSSAVEGMTPENVTVLDSRGNVLSERMENDPLARLSSSQLELQQKVEAGLVAKGQALLDKRFGPGRSAIQVTARLEFTQKEQSRETYDADNPAVRSEEITTNTSMGSDTSSSQSESQITNYELNLTKEHTINSIGDVKRLSIAVMVDGHYNTAGEGKNTKREFAPLSPTELSDVQQTIEAALGYDQNRGDDISVTSVPFQDNELLDDSTFVGVERWDVIFRYGQKVITIAAIILLLLMLRNFIRRAQSAVRMYAGRPMLPAGEEAAPQLTEAGAAALPPMEAAASAQAQDSRRTQERITRFVDEQPDVAARLVRSWLVEG